MHAKETSPFFMLKKNTTNKVLLRSGVLFCVNYLELHYLAPIINH